jgi:hypothetical protein
MRRLGPTLVVSLLILLAAQASARRCGDDVDGRGQAVPCDCGDLLVSSRTLGDEDPITSRVCPGTALLVQVPPDRPAATLALAGRVLAGSGRGFGVHVLSGGAGGMTISGPGEIRRFDTAVLAVRGTLARLADVTAADNRSDGFDIAGTGYAITGCEALRNGRDGFALRGSGYRAEGNRALANARSGFAFAGRDAAIGHAAGNEAAGNGRDGMSVRGRGHELRNPIATANGGRGITAHVRGGRISGALATGNRAHGLHAAGSDLGVEGSQAEDNGGGGIAVRGARVHDGGGNRGEDCWIGAACR